jgi:hypothetical protein
MEVGVEGGNGVAATRYRVGHVGSTRPSEHLKGKSHGYVLENLSRV